MLTDQRPPALAPCLRTALAVRQDTAVASTLPARIFDAAEAACDAADARYRETFARVLPKRAAREAAELTETFRASVRTLRAAAADNGCRDCRMVQRPGDRYDARSHAVSLPNLRKQRSQCLQKSPR